MHGAKKGTRCGMRGAKTRVGQEFDVKPVSSPTDSGSTLTHHTPSTPSQATGMQESIMSVLERESLRCGMDLCHGPQDEKTSQ